MGDDEEAVASSTTQYLTQEDNQDDLLLLMTHSSPGEPVEEHLEDPTSPTLDQKPTKEQVELLLLALKLKHGLTNSALEDIMHLINFSAGPGGELAMGRGEDRRKEKGKTVGKIVGGPEMPAEPCSRRLRLGGPARCRGQPRAEAQLSGETG
ncbi:hypothetical protein G5714_004610 [Onychostoma macrolepis]|uniref:Uncharacterized protein n=1 Tax=Onychostoma macrolepis TaxID=369639 RepID=A0A7J6D577_9TELE|nr:hypothetical protein G5714_004610 [Onychostoma macrolepis]